MGVSYNQLFDLQNKFLTEHNGLCGKSCYFISPHMFTAVADIFSTFTLDANFSSAALLCFFSCSAYFFRVLFFSV